MHPSVKNGLLVGMFGLLGAIILALATVWSQHPSRVVSTGSIQVSGGEGPTQVNVGSPSSTQIINTPRAFSPNAIIKKGRKDGDYFLHIILEQTPGIWDQGTRFELYIKTTGPFKDSKIVKGLSSVNTDVRIRENKEAGEFFYSTTTPPLKDTPVVLEIVSADEVGVSDLNVKPLQERKSKD